MKKILIIFTGALEPGGIERSLIGLLDAIDYEHYSVDLFLYGHHGALFSQINPKVHLFREVKNLAWLRESLVEKIRHGAFYSAFCRILDGISNNNHDETWKRIALHCVKQLPDSYDIALGFFAPFDILKKRVNARIKVGWVHTDYSNAEELSIASLNELRNSYSGLDRIVAVSDACLETFVSVFPEFENKMMVIENVLPSKMIIQQAEEFVPSDEMPDNGNIKLLTIGRFSYAKRIDEIPSLCARIRKLGVNIVWYIIGYGSDEQLIRQNIIAEHMENYVVLLGKKDNPYPYLEACDVYVQPSRYEGKCVAVREAQMLAKPVIITEYATSASQLENGIDGIIVPMDLDNCASAISKVLRDNALLEKLAANCRKRDYSNADEVQKLYELMK
ncbi:MAG: glycosyltransferase [Bacteroidales bacterium]|nr:glycosyltransferase [Bacteroidales bacterium]MCC8153388.1 glycosyltransferase [Tannerellaceae bacterium]